MQELELCNKVNKKMCNPEMRRKPLKTHYILFYLRIALNIFLFGFQFLLIVYMLCK